MATDNSKNSSKKTGEGMSSQDTEKVMLVLSYIGVLALVPYLSVKDSKSIRFHARQGMALAIVEIGIMFFYYIFSSFLFFGILYSMIANIISLGLFALSVWGIMNALGKKDVKLPIAGQIADSLNL